MSRQTSGDPDKDFSFQEWKACRDSLAHFDDIIVDLRKFGFSLITILLSANGFLFTISGIGVVAILGIFVALLVLITGLFRLDRVHEVFIRATVIRAMDLEDISRSGTQSGFYHKMGQSWLISYWSEKLQTATWGHFLYSLFCFAAYVLAIAGILSDKAISCSTIPPVVIFATATGGAGIWLIQHQHKKASELQNKFLDKVNTRTKEFGYDELEYCRYSASHIWQNRLLIFLLLISGGLAAKFGELVSVCNQTGPTWPF